MAETYPKLVSALVLVVGSRGVAEDCVQEALARAWERSERGMKIDSLPAWVTTVSMNLSRSWLRRQRVERRARQGTTEDRAREPDGVALDVRKALSALPRSQREATVLRYYLDLNIAEIATVLGIGEGTVKSTLFRARRKLAHALRLDEQLEAGSHGS